MKYKNWTKPEEFWKDWQEYYWKPALSLPTLPWARPFLEMMGLPQAMIEEPEVWTSIGTQLLAEYNTGMKPADKLGGSEYDIVRLRVTEIVVTKGFKQLANQLGKTVVVEFERWVRRHFLCREVDNAMYHWMRILRTMVLPPNTRIDQIPPPAAVMPLLPEIDKIVYHEEDIELEDALKRAMPPMTPEELKLTGGEVVLSREASVIQQVIRQELTMKALKTIAENLNESELSEMLAWALSQAEAISVTSLKRLCGDKYLRVELPYFDLPSVLDLPREN